MATLYVVATPIGNLNDMTPRAVETLKGVSLIAAEDTRQTMKLCQVFDIHTPMTSVHRHNEADKGRQIAERMAAENIDVAVVTDAGTPCVSDPGWGLIEAALELNIPVMPVPGCCAAVAALSVCGFDTRAWAFYGFLPREKKELRAALTALLQGPPIAVVHESPFRVIDLVEAVAETLPGARISLSCDLTKLHELTVRGTAEEVLEILRANPKAEKGEYCAVLDLHAVPVPEAESGKQADISLEARLVECMCGGLSLRESQEKLTAAGEKKNAVKQAALRLKRLFANEA